MKQNLLGILILFSSVALNAQQRDNDFKTIEINKIVREYPDKFDLSSPLNSYICFKYLLSQGKQGLYRSANSYKIQSFFPKGNTPDTIIKEEKRESMLNIKINEIIIYKDSVAGVLTDPPSNSSFPMPMQIIAFLRFEDGKWLNAGEGLGNDMNDARSKFKENAPIHLEIIHQISKLKNVSRDTALFVNYLKNNGKTPKAFILNALATHKIAVYGEIHKRKISWDLLKETINSPEFIKYAGTVFMELPSDKQGEANRFFANEKLEPEIILNILRNELVYGWDDKGMYEFLIELWKRNRELPKNEKINVVLVEIPKPFDSLANLKEYEAFFENVLDRNEQMAKIIYETVKNKNDMRNSLFIVGASHAYKSLVPDLANDGRQQKDAKLSAVAQLVQLFSDEDVFTIFPHCAIISNNGTISGKIRNGLFDAVFAEAGNKPVGFELKNSPFGKEYFDGLTEIAYGKENGSFDHVYDGYLFLQPLEEEQDRYLLYEMFSDKYVEELKRRAIMSNDKVEDWYDVKEVTKEAIITNLKRSENKKRWTNL